jgi:hypothetical protein
MARHHDEEQQNICLYCEHAQILQSGEQVLCPYRGILGVCSTCRRFRYDILKRTPSAPKRILMPDARDLLWEEYDPCDDSQT